MTAEYQNIQPLLLLHMNPHYLASLPKHIDHKFLHYSDQETYYGLMQQQPHLSCLPEPPNAHYLESLPEHVAQGGSCSDQK
jgi:hypothetical protein